MIRVSNIINCSCCGRPFEVTPDKRRHAKRGRRFYCKDECRREAQKSRMPTLEERFWAHVKRLANGCLECSFKPQAGGYPKMRAGNTMKPVSHVAWFEHYGWWPPADMVLDHVCHPNTCTLGRNCPHRRCAEWSHLRLTTKSVNGSAERSASGRLVIARFAAQMYCAGGHERTPENIWIDPKTGNKHCRVCWRIRSAKRYGLKKLGTQAPGQNLLVERNQ